MGSQVLANFILPTATAYHKSKYPISLPLSVSDGDGGEKTGKERSLSWYGASFVHTAGGKGCITFREIRARFRCNCQLSLDIAPVTSAAYGVLLFCGGLFAYARTGSKGSFIGGLTGAALMSTAYFLMQASETKEIGYALAFGSALLFTAVFGIRVAATRKIYPAGFLLGLSIGALAVFISPYLQD